MTWVANRTIQIGMGPTILRGQVVSEPTMQHYPVLRNALKHGWLTPSGEPIDLPTVGYRPTAWELILAEEL